MEYGAGNEFSCNCYRRFVLLLQVPSLLLVGDGSLTKVLDKLITVGSLVEQLDIITPIF